MRITGFKREIEGDEEEWEGGAVITTALRCQD
jgi:hypothetical protein